MKAYIGTPKGTASVDIESAQVIFSEKEEEKMIKKFNKDTRALEFGAGTTYCVTYSDPKGRFQSHRLKSSSLDELLEMYKCAWKGKEIPQRKCFFFPKDLSKKPR